MMGTTATSVKQSTHRTVGFFAKSLANGRFCTKTPFAVVHAVATCVNLLQNRKQWQPVSATGGPMVLGYTRVSKGEEQDTHMQETA